MSDPEFGNTPPPSGEPIEPAWSAPESPIPGTPPPVYSQVPPPNYTDVPPPPPPGYPPQGGYVTPGAGLSDQAAGAIAYLTIIPAIIFLVIAPYNQRPFVKFHAIQEVGLSLVLFILHFIAIIPILGWAVWLVGVIIVFVLWVICIFKASQGGALKLPIIGKFAAEQSGYAI
jgi:uncharacterized membrane protein